jgi:hypothetical protein
MRTDLYLMEKKAKNQPKRTAFSDAFIQACERREAKDADKRKSLERRETRQAKRTAPQTEEVEG